MSNLLTQEEIQALVQRLHWGDGLLTPPEQGEESAPFPAGEIKSKQAGGHPAATKKIIFNEIKRGTVLRKDGQIKEMNHICLDLIVVLGEIVLTVGELLQLKEDSVIVLDRLAGENARLFANGNYLADGEIIVLNDCFAFRVTFAGEGDRKTEARPPAEEEERESG